MGSNSAVAITPGSGANIDVFQVTGGDLQQIIREARASAMTTNSWTVSTTAATSQITADENRLGLIIYNAANVVVYLRFDSTAPLTTGANAHYRLDAGDRFEVPQAFSQLNVSFVAATAGSGTVNSALATAS